MAEEETTEREVRRPQSEAAGVRATREDEGHQLREMLIIGAIASVIGIAAGLLIDWFPVSASGEAKQIDTVWDVLLIASVPIFVLVEVVVLYCVWKFRMRPGEEQLDGPPIHGNTRLEVIWTAIPAILLVALCTYAYIVLTDIEEAKADTMNVRVVGEQFAWTFYYPGPGGKEVASNQLYLPVDRPVKFTVQTEDVIHDFWVPAFRLKIDAVRGIDTSYRVTPDRQGTYPVVCAELCGLGHSTMRSTVRVVPRADFDKWLTDLRAKAGGGGGGGGGEEAGGGGGGGEEAGGGGAAADGKALFTQGAQPACGSCHTLAAAGTTAQTGPDLDDVLKGKDKAFIKESIEDPEAEIARGFSPGIMPDNYGQSLSPEELDALVNYLSEETK
jgi:cytochrome c oxidase subunit 2